MNILLMIVSGLIILTSMTKTAASPSQVRANGKVARYAIVIGKNEPEDIERETLRYADDDAILTHKLLGEAGVHSTLLVSPDTDTSSLHPIERINSPTPQTLFRSVENVFSEIESRLQQGFYTELIFFYSGHGDVVNGEGFVVLENGRLTRTELLNKIIARSPAHINHVIIDACNSYYMVFSKGPGGKRRSFNKAFGAAESGKKMERTGFILSASSQRDSHEWERYQAGIFSYEIRSALRGGADANQDGRITYAELGAFVTTANKGIINPKFRPDFFVTPPGRHPSNLDRPLLTWSTRSNTLLVDAAFGHFYIETKSGVRIADVHPAAAQQLTLRLPSERPLFLRRANDKEEGVLKGNHPTKLSVLSLHPTAIARKGALNIAFESLFSHSFEANAVSAYKKSLSNSYGVKLNTVHDHKKKTPRLNPLRHALLTTAIGSFVVSGTMSILAMSRLSKAEDSSQVELPEINQSIERFNTTAVVFYSVAAATGVSWLTLTLWSRKNKKRSVSFNPSLHSHGFHLGVQGNFGP